MRPPSRSGSSLASIYTRLADEPHHRPAPNVAPRDGQQWMADLTFRDVLRIARRDIVDAIRGRGPVHGFHRDYDGFRAATPTDAAWVKHRIPAEKVAAMDRAAAARGCTRNDLLVTGFARAFAEFAPQGPKAKTRIGLTINLRRYAPIRRRYPVCSMVGIGYVSVGPDLGPSFDDTLAQVSADTGRQKKGLIGVANPLYIRVLTAMSFRRKRGMVDKLMRKVMSRPMAPTFSNGGRITASKLRFDSTAPRAAGFVVFPCQLPMFLVSALEYEGAVTLTVCYQPSEQSADEIRRMLEQVEREVPVEPAAGLVPADKEIA